MRASRALPLMAPLLGCWAGGYQPRALHDQSATGPGRFECWDTDRDCQSDAVHACGSYRGRPRGIRIVDRRELADARGRKLIVLEVECTP